MRLAAGCALCLMFAGCESGQPADTILFNGKIVTLDDAAAVVQAAAIRDGVFVALGSRDAVDPYVGTSTEQIDLEGRTVIPGLADNHFHSSGGGPGVDLSGVRTLEELLDAAARRAALLDPDGIVVTNSNWHEISAGVMGAEQRVSRMDALRLATIQNAYLNFEEQIKGTIEVGKLAELAVLSDDLLEIPAEQIEGLGAVMTMVGGRIVYSAPGR